MECEAGLGAFSGLRTGVPPTEMVVLKSWLARFGPVSVTHCTAGLILVLRAIIVSGESCTESPALLACIGAGQGRNTLLMGLLSTLASLVPACVAYVPSSDHLGGKGSGSGPGEGSAGHDSASPQGIGRQPRATVGTLLALCP